MSETQPTTDTTRPWGDRPVASGVEAVFLWAKQEMAAMHEKFSGALTAAHDRIDELEAKARTPVPAPAPVQTIAAPQSSASVGGAVADPDTTKGAAS